MSAAARVAGAIVLATALSAPAPARPAADPRVALTRLVAGLAQPTHVTHAGDGSGRLFVVEQTGQVRIVRNGALETTPFLSIGDRITCCGERGLLSIAFPPDYALKGYLYVSYTDTAGNSVISRFFVSADPDVVDPATESILLTITQPAFTNHKGGQIAFGPDGYLYAGFGDGGSAGDPNNFAQNLADLPGNRTFLGKLLRIDVESGAVPYAVPATNPLLNGAQSEIWALGLRNPWRFSFDRLTGDLFIADVGQNLYEEVDFQSAGSAGGENYGWRLMEGDHCYNPATGCNDDPQLVLTTPVLEYGHDLGNCSITGGFPYRGARYPTMQGVYFYGDLCSGRIWGANAVGGAWQNRLLIDSTLVISTFGEDEEGELYVADYASGTLYQVVVADRIGVFRRGSWYFDASTIGVWEGCALEACLGPFGGGSSDLPVMGDWTGSGSAKIGVFRNGAWYLDRDGGGTWDGCGTTVGSDICYTGFGVAGDLPVAGDWTGGGTDKIGVFRNGDWFLDRDGGGTWDGCGTTAGTDICYRGFGVAGDLPVAGDWTGTGTAKIGVFRRGAWYLDRDGGGAWDGCGTTGGTDICHPNFGNDGDVPVVGDWTGSGSVKIGLYRSAAWYQDLNGNGSWDTCAVDLCIESFGLPLVDIPVVAKPAR